MKENQVIKDEEKLVVFNGSQIPQVEADFLESFEIHEEKWVTVKGGGMGRIHKRQFKLVEEVKQKDYMKFSVKNGRVTGIGLYQCGGSTLPESIGEFTSLQTLILESSALTTLPESIGQLTSLKELDLKFNKITALPESIGNLKMLRSLDLLVNKVKALPESIGNCMNLETLDLTANGVMALPESIGNLKSLKRLMMQNNQSFDFLMASLGLRAIATADKRYFHDKWEVNVCENCFNSTLNLF